MQAVDASSPVPRAALVEIAVRDPAVRIVSGKQLWAMKRSAQARDRVVAERGEVPPEAMLMLGPERFEARIKWPEDAQIDE